MNFYLLKNRSFLVFTAILTMLSCPAFPITSKDVFEDGRRAFMLSNWTEAYALLDKFLSTWPNDSLFPEALYYKALAEIRMEKFRRIEEEKAKIGSLSAMIKFFSEKFPEKDLSEMEIELETMSRKLEPAPASSTSILTLSPQKLLHAIRRGWFAAPDVDPVGTLKWTAEWKAKHKGRYMPALNGLLELMRAKALWKIRLSPLPSIEFMSILKIWGVWPLDSALVDSLRKAFRDGDPDTKYQTALLGLCFEYSKSWRFSRKDSEWIRYLEERGIHKSEAWCPK